MDLNVIDEEKTEVNIIGKASFNHKEA